MKLKTVILGHKRGERATILSFYRKNPLGTIFPLCTIKILSMKWVSGVSFYYQRAAQLKMSRILFTKLCIIGTYKVTPGTNIQETFIPFSVLSKFSTHTCTTPMGQTPEFLR